MMKTQLRHAFNYEMKQAISLYQQKQFEAAFMHLERAHILGQAYIIPHTQSHWWMLKIGLNTRDTREILGQLPRILASIVFSRIWVPIGNTGGAKVNPFKPMPISEDLQQVLQKDA